MGTFLVMLLLLLAGAALVGVLMLVFGVVLAVTVGVALALVFKLLPLALLVWLAVVVLRRLLRPGRPRPAAGRLSAADEAWLEGR